MSRMKRWVADFRGVESSLSSSSGVSDLSCAVIFSVSKPANGCRLMMLRCRQQDDFVKQHEP